eukprot:2795074-Lingulodinium_polyedra.AAC.1
MALAFASARATSHSRGFSSSHTPLSLNRCHSLSRAFRASGSLSSSDFPTGRATQALEGNDRSAI